MEYKDYYKIMGVERDATQDEIKRSYRKLTRKYHPDVSKEPDAEEHFKEVGEAYVVLKDPEKRAAYDQLGANLNDGQDFSPPPNWDAGFEFHGGADAGVSAGDHSSFFEDLFGHGYAAQGPGTRQTFHMHGEDHHAKVLIDLEDSYTGATRTITLRAPELTDDGHLTLRERSIKLKIPKGVRPGQQIRLSEQGAPGLGGAKPGDLYLEVEFREHSFYRVAGSDVYLDLPVTPWEAALGAVIKAPTPSGAIDLKIPDNSNQGGKLRLKGRGLPGKEPGDMYVVLKVILPPADSETAKTLYKQMEDQLEFNPRATMTMGAS